MHKFLAMLALYTFVASCGADDPSLDPGVEPGVAPVVDPGVDPAVDPGAKVDESPADPAELTYERLESPARTEVYDRDGEWLATFTDGSRTVRLRGPSRKFAESSAVAPVITSDWVRILPAAFAGTVDDAWLTAARVDDSPDILAIAAEYVIGGNRDASYGPLVDGVRQEGSDFHDYLGMSWKFPTGTVVAADPAQIGSLDCSGFQRMVWGYRGGIELVLTARADRSALPRKAVDIYASGPGVITMPNSGAQIRDLSGLDAGDLVFFDASTDDGTAIDHVGVYLGQDTAGHARFISSRKMADGPTFGDIGGASILDGAGLYARSLRAARRL